MVNSIPTIADSVRTSFAYPSTSEQGIIKNYVGIVVERAHDGVRVELEDETPAGKKQYRLLKLAKIVGYTVLN